MGGKLKATGFFALFAFGLLALLAARNYNGVFLEDEVQKDYNYYFFIHPVASDDQRRHVSIEQTFICTKNGFSGLDIRVKSKQISPDVNVFVEILDDKDNVVYKQKKDFLASEANGNIQITFTPQMESRDRKYSVRISAAENSDLYAELYAFDGAGYKDGDFFADGVKLERDLAFKILYEKTLGELFSPLVFHLKAEKSFLIFYMLAALIILAAAVIFFIKHSRSEK